MKTLEHPTHRQLCALVHQLVDERPTLGADQAELEDRLKWACARHGWLYDSERVRKAVEAVVWVRSHRRAS